ncbi:FtsQ-type POTRA domain-containing protein [Cryobacterium sp. AP23]
MKRPPGVPQAPRPASPREPERSSDRSATAPAAGRTAPARPRAAPAGAKSAPTTPPAGSAASQTAPARSEPDATTEPITVPTTGTATPTATRDADPANPSEPGAPARRPAEKPRTQSPVREADTAAPTAAPGLLARLAARPRSTPAQEKPLTARLARKRLRAARRARKQYERSEVRRFTSRSRRRRNLWIAAAGTVVALVAFVLVGVYSPLMALRTIEVTGTNRIPAADIAQALDGQLDTPLPLIDFAEVKEELSQFSLIRSYVTESRPPDTLVVRIVEREPIGMITSAAGFDLVDAAGVVITSGADRTEGYPVIDAANGASGAGFQAAVAVVGALPEGIRSQLDTVTAATKDDVTLTLVGGARVVWGNSERAEYKAIVLSALLVGHPVGSVTEYDVSSPDSAVVR